MSWVTVIWSISAGACLTLAFLQFIVWCKSRAARANLVFALGAVAVAVFAGVELALMRAKRPHNLAHWSVDTCPGLGADCVDRRLRSILPKRRPPMARVDRCGVRTLALILNFILSRISITGKLLLCATSHFGGNSYRSP